MPETILTRADQGRAVELAPGADAVIELDESPTTGYRWSLEEPLPAGMSLLGSDYEPRTSALGAGGLRRFRLRASETGGGALSLKLWREWAGDASVVDRFQVSFSVKA